MEKLIEILEDIQPDADYETCTTLIDDGILDSFCNPVYRRRIGRRVRCISNTC